MTEIKVKKTADLNAYMNVYMKKRYEANPQQQRNYKNSLTTKRRYVISPEVWGKYKENLHTIVALKEMINNLPPDVFETFLVERDTLTFEKRQKKNN